MSGHTQSLVLPWETGVGHDDLHIWPINRHIIQMHRVAVCQAQTSAASHATANSAVPCVKDGGQFVLVDHIIDGPSHLVVGVIALYGWVKFKTLDPLFFNQALCLARAHLTFVWIDTGKCHHHVAVLFGGIRNFFVRNTATPCLRLTVHSEHDQSHIVFTVVGYSFINCGAGAGTKVFVCRSVVLLPVVIKRVTTTHLGVGVDVNGDKVFVIHAQSPKCFLISVTSIG